MAARCLFESLMTHTKATSPFLTPGPLLFRPALPSSLQPVAQISPLPTAPASCSFSWGLPQPPQLWLHLTPCFLTATVHHPLPAFASTWTLLSPAPFPTLAGSMYASCSHTQCTPHWVVHVSTPSPPQPAASTS